MGLKNVILCLMLAVTITIPGCIETEKTPIKVYLTDYQVNNTTVISTGGKSVNGKIFQSGFEISRNVSTIMVHLNWSPGGYLANPEEPDKTIINLSLELIPPSVNISCNPSNYSWNRSNESTLEGNIDLKCSLNPIPESNIQTVKHEKRLKIQDVEYDVGIGTWNVEVETLRFFFCQWSITYFYWNLTIEYEQFHHNLTRIK